MEKIYKARQDEAVRRMMEQGITRALITSPVNILYLTGAGIVPYERFTGFILDTAGKSHLVVPEFEKGHCRDGHSLELTYQDHQDALSLVEDIARGGDSLGVEKKILPLVTAERLGETFQFREVDSILEAMRLKKDESEIDKMRTAARYTGEILDAVKNKLATGKSEQDIKFELFRGILLEPALKGAASPIQVSSGIHASMAHGMEGDRKLEKGEPVIIDFGVIYQDYRSDITRTFFVGEPKEEFARMYQVVLEAQERAIAVVKPGIRIKEIDLAARKHIEEAGFAKYFTIRIGHGLGMEIHEPPSVHNLNETVLEEGMAFTIEPGIYIPGLGGVRVEDDIIAGHEGAVVLTQYPKALADMVIG